MLKEISEDTSLIAGVVLAIAAILTAIQLFVPDWIQQAFVFDHSEFVWYTLWTSAYVHLNLDHLYGNLFGFLIVIFALSILYTLRERQRILLWSLFGFLAVFPILVSLSDYVIFYLLLEAENAATRGFSGVIAGLFGLLLASLIEFVWNRTSIKEASGVGLAIVLSTMLMMLITAGEASPQMIFLGGFGVLLSLSLVIPWNELGSLSELPSVSKDNLEDIAIISFEVLVLVILLPRLFPLSWVGENSLTNIFGHFVGLLLGAFYGVLLGLVLTERGKISIRKRKHLPRVYLSRILVWIFHLKTLLSIVLPIGFGIIGFFAGRNNRILAGATLLYASVLLFREVPDQVSLRINSIGFMDSVEYQDTFAILSYVENIGNVTAEDVIVYYRFYNPISGFRTREREARIGDGTTRGTVDIDPGHQETFIAHLGKSALPEDDISDDWRLEVRVEARNQHFSTFSVSNGIDLQASRVAVSGMRGIDNELDY